MVCSHVEAPIKFERLNETARKEAQQYDVGLCNLGFHYPTRLGVRTGLRSLIEPFSSFDNPSLGRARRPAVLWSE